jgi:menaquinone-dependent protoporphyrinogen oxidase
MSADPAAGSTPRILLVYATKHGHTAKIAARVADGIREAGGEVDVRELANDVSPSGYAAAVVGASIHAGHHQREMVDWVKRHAVELNGMPSAFFSVSLAAAEDTDEARAETRKYIDDFVDETGWTPGRAESLAGALLYREYDFATRLVMRLIMKRGGHPTDTSHDYDYTDWDAASRFGGEVAAMITVAGARR